MEYRNKKTGAVISVPCEINGGDWEALKPPKAVVEEPKEPIKDTKKKTKR